MRYVGKDSMSNGYYDVKKAAEAELKAIWGGWMFGGFLWLMLCVWLDGVPILGTLVYWLLWVFGVIATGAAIWASFQLARREERARHDALEG